MDREQEEKNNAMVQQIYDRLQDIQLQQRAILNNIPDMVWLKDKESRFLEVNEAFGAACGLTPEEVKGKTDLDIWPRELAESYRADDQEVMTTKKSKCVEERLADKQGQIQWIETIKTPVFDNKGAVVGVTGIARDITERKRIEDRLKEIRAELEIRVKVRTVELTRANEELHKEISDKKNYEKELQVYREKLELLVSHRTKALELEVESRKAAQQQANALRQQLEFILKATKTELVIIDKDFQIRYIDPERVRKYGNWEGKKCFDYFMYTKSPCTRCNIEKALKTKKIIVTEEKLDKEDNRTVQVTTIPFQNDTGEWLVAEVNMDISERKKIDDELWRYREHLEELVEERSGQLMQEISLHKKAEIEKSKLNYDLLKSYEKLKSI
ncbi:PAS domain S-box protein, partial [bacterium]